MQAAVLVPGLEALTTEEGLVLIDEEAVADRPVGAVFGVLGLGLGNPAAETGNRGFGAHVAALALR